LFFSCDLAQIRYRATVLKFIPPNQITGVRSCLSVFINWLWMRWMSSPTKRSHGAYIKFYRPH